ncbi:YHS domain-containing protein [Halobacteriales archaeon QS_1_67_19]|nr:MAG: YHS domain-containing protein [Halobacteriales archaeon QS_1_67_19]
MARCPVCEADIDRSSPEETDYREASFAETQVEYEGETYTFCSEEHRREFEENPEEYV